MFFWVVVFLMMLAEHIHFGWNNGVETDAEIVCDMIIMAVIALRFQNR